MRGLSPDDLAEIERMERQYVGRMRYLGHSMGDAPRECRRRYLERYKSEPRWWDAVPIDDVIRNFAWGMHRISSRELHDELAVFDGALERQISYNFHIRWERLDGTWHSQKDRIAVAKALLREAARLGIVDRDRWVWTRRLVQEQTEREERWRIEKQHRAEMARQRQFLRQGHDTLTALRRYLRDRRLLPLLASRPAKTSRT